MTPLGFTILDTFSECLESHKRLLYPRNAEILQKLYNWEERQFPKETAIAKGLDLTPESVRSLEKQTLKKLRASSERNRYAAKIIRILDHYGLKEERNSRHKTVVRFWLNELQDFPGLPIVKLLSRLYLSTNQEVFEALEHFRSLQGLRPRDIRKLNHLKRTYSNQRHLKEQLTRNIIWFDHVRLWKEDVLNTKVPKRKVIRYSTFFFSGDFFSQKCQRNIQYESNIELDFIQKLEACNVVRSFLDQPVCIPFANNGKPSHYTPDFAVLLTDGRLFITEIKSSYEEMLDAALHRKMEALIEYCEKHGFGILLTNGKRSLNYLFHYPCKPGLEEALQTHLNSCGDEGLSLDTCNSILFQYQANKDHLFSLAMKNNWGLRRNPFTLTANNPCNIFRQKVIKKLPGFAPSERLKVKREEHLP